MGKQTSASERGMDSVPLRADLQPIIRLSSGHISGFEALARLPEPSANPERFLPNLFGLYGRPAVIERMTSEAISSYREVMHLISKDSLPSSGALPYLAINFEPEDLDCDETVKTLFTVLQRLEFPPSNFRIEITEHTQLRLNPRLLNNISKIYASGISIAIDDFGSGFAAMSMLSQISFDCVKLDRSFVQDITSNSRSQLLLTQLCNMLEGFETSIVAEGVEDQATALLLHQAGCEHVQGYYYAYPNKPAGLVNSIKGNHPHWALGQLERKQLSPPTANSFFDRCLDICIIISFDGYLLRVNRAFTQKIGWSMRELTNSHFAKFSHPDDIENIVQKLQKLSQGEIIASLVMRLIQPSGAHKWVEWSGAPDIERRAAYAVGRVIDEPAGELGAQQEKQHD